MKRIDIDVALFLAGIGVILFAVVTKYQVSGVGVGLVLAAAIKWIWQGRA